tara:strand:- start:160 stop:846 length:687 start_codon:yes stop_codon:yes gene_type:complete
MKTKREQNSIKTGEKGNVLIYVLIAIALFGALSFALSRQTRNSGTEDLDEAKAELYAVQLITYATQAKSVIDQMMFTGSDIDELDFTTPSETSFNTAPHIHKVFHPQGGGLTLATIPKNAIHEISSVNGAKWYLGRFNNVEWSKTSATEIILTAHQINEKVCAAINNKITGFTTIPLLTGDIKDFLLDTSTNNDLTASSCAACEGYVTLCVGNNAGSAYSFYTVLADR